MSQTKHLTLKSIKDILLYFNKKKFTEKNLMFPSIQAKHFTKLNNIIKLSQP